MPFYPLTAFPAENRFTGFRPNARIATALVPEGSLGLRISDILKMRRWDIIRDDDCYRPEVAEKKTRKHKASSS